MENTWCRTPTQFCLSLSNFRTNFIFAWQCNDKTAIEKIQGIKMKIQTTMIVCSLPVGVITAACAIKFDDWNYPDYNHQNNLTTGPIRNCGTPHPDIQPIPGPTPPLRRRLSITKEAKTS